MKKILLLGAGLVSAPMVRYLLDQDEFQLTVATRTVSKAEALVGDHPRGRALALNVDSHDELESLIESHDLAISLLPWTLHVRVAKLCLKHEKHFVTTSYVSDALRELGAEAKEKGLTFLNELGVDPGIDHMSAMQIIDAVHARKGKIETFYSLCGGLPAPKNNNNPLGYKFSWSPRGVVLASRNPARYLRDLDVVEIEGRELFSNYSVGQVEGVGELEFYPNRDSVPYREIYGIPEVNTLMRGTYRYVGWCRTFKKIADLGLTDDTSRPHLAGQPMSAMLSEIVDHKSGSLRDSTASALKLEADDPILDRLEWLGLFSDTPISCPDLNYLDIFCDAMMGRMQFAEGEVDMLVMQHEFITKERDGGRKRITATMVEYGVPGGESAMAKTVALPAAIGTRLILEGKITERGVCIPNIPTIYEPVMAELATLGISFDEKVEDL